MVASIAIAQQRSLVSTCHQCRKDCDISMSRQQLHSKEILDCFIEWLIIKRKTLNRFTPLKLSQSIFGIFSQKSEAIKALVRQLYFDNDGMKSKEDLGFSKLENMNFCIEHAPKNFADAETQTEKLCKFLLECEGDLSKLGGEFPWCCCIVNRTKRGTDQMSNIKEDNLCKLNLDKEGNSDDSKASSRKKTSTPNESQDETSDENNADPSDVCYEEHLQSQDETYDEADDDPSDIEPSNVSYEEHLMANGVEPSDSCDEIYIQAAATDIIQGDATNSVLEDKQMA